MNRVSRVAALAAVAIPAATIALLPANAQAPAPAPAAGGPIDRFGRLAEQQVQITAGTTSDSASVALQVGGWTLTSKPSESEVERIDDTFHLILSTPFNGKDDAAPATLDGLANGTALTLRWGRFFTYTSTGAPSARIQQIVAQASERCKDKVNEALDPIFATLNPATQQAEIAKLERTKADRLHSCMSPPTPTQNLVSTYAPELAREYIAELVPADAFEYGLEASIGRKAFAFVDPATLAPSKATETPWSVRAFYNQYLRRSKTALTFSLAYQRSYHAADDNVFCPGNPENAVVKCTTAAGAPPKKNESLLLSAGLRHQFAPSGLLAGIATAPLVTYDALSNVFGVDVPVYFIPDKSGGLTGGVRFGYRSDKDKLSFGVFIGAAFDILK